MVARWQVLASRVCYGAGTFAWSHIVVVTHCGGDSLLGHAIVVVTLYQMLGHGLIWGIVFTMLV